MDFFTGERSVREAGHDGLAQTRGHRSPVSLVQHITGTTRADATKQVPLSWDGPLVAAVVAGAITAAQDDTIRRGLGTPPVTDTDPVSDAVTVEAWRVAVEQLIAEAGVRTVDELGRAARTVRNVSDPVSGGDRGPGPRPGSHSPPPGPGSTHHPNDSRP